MRDRHLDRWGYVGIDEWEPEPLPAAPPRPPRPALPAEGGTDVIDEDSTPNVIVIDLV
jgi:hypothetical protein